MHLHLIDRRTFLAGGLTLAALSACGGGGITPDRLGARFPDGFRSPSVAVTGHGAQRFPFVLVADDGLPMLTDAPSSIDIEVLRNGTTLTTETVAVRGVGQFTPFYPLEFTPPETGSYVARTDFSDFDLEFAVVERSDTTLFQVGEQLPPFETPTFADARNVDPVCTRNEACPFHQVSLAEAVSNGKPTALLIATPAFCQTDVCGANLEWLIELAEGRSDINVIHAEVYEDFARDTNDGRLPTRSPILAEWDFAFEPSLFIADASGTIVEGKHFAFDRDETAEMLLRV